MQSSVYVGELMHHRLKPKTHRFSYRVASWLLDLDEIDALDNSLTLFSRGRFNIVSFYHHDYGNGSDTPLREQITALLWRHDIDSPDKIRLLCYPRIFGYTFNPLAVYFCYKDQNLISVVYEVSNTFGERHAYVAAVSPDSGNDHVDKKSLAHNPQSVVQQQADKRLHVSPFFPMDCHYHFRVRPPEQVVSLSITLNNADGKLFTAVFRGQRQPISDRFIVKQTLLLPLQSLKVIAAIHWEALRLWLKGVSVYTHKPRNFFFSHSRAQGLANREKKL